MKSKISEHEINRRILDFSKQLVRDIGEDKNGAIGVFINVIIPIDNDQERALGVDRGMSINRRLNMITAIIDNAEKVNKSFSEN